MAGKVLKRNLFQRLFGICATAPPQDEGCWDFSEGKINIDLTRAPELSKPGNGIRLEGRNLPQRMLVIHGDDNQYHAFQNRCSHMGRRLDAVPESGTVQCCSVGKTTCDYSGQVLFGSGKKPITTYPVEAEPEKLMIKLD